MIQVLGSVVFGFLKGYANGHPGRYGNLGFGEYAAGAVREEVLFRALPVAVAGHALGHYAGPITAASFALAHQPATLGRFADVFAGGMLYHSAYKQYGLFGATVAHLAHNLAIGWGAQAAQRPRRRSAR